MAFLATLARFKRGDLSLFLVAALFSALLLPANAGAATLPPQSMEAVLLWIHAEIGVSQTVAPNLEKTAFAPALTAPQSLENLKKSPQNSIFSFATAHCGLFRAEVAPQTPQILAPVAVHQISAHVVARLSGVALNVWRN